MTPDDTNTQAPEDPAVPAPADPAPPEPPHPSDPVFDEQHGIRRPSPGVRIFDPDGTGSKAFG
jgi:hypothetical protein